MNAPRPFQVDLRGVVDLLSRHIYSSPQVYLRELLQNAMDAIAARQQVDPNAPEGLVRVQAGDGQVIFADNGIGLTATEAADLLATVGRSSKRDEVLGLRREEFLGQFGIGLLSCFLIADDIVVRSRSARGGAAIEWIGSSNGTFSIREITDELPVGTQVLINARLDDTTLTSAHQVRTLLHRFGEFLPCRVELVASGRTELITRDAPFLGNRDDATEFGHDLLGVTPLDTIPIRVAGSATAGTAYVLPFAPPPGSQQPHRVYLGRMLLSERVPDLVPDWAFFVRCVLNTDTLSPTASREALVENAALQYTRDEIGAILRRWIVALASGDPGRFQVFVTVHQLALKSMALHDEDLARALLPHVSIETSAGQVTIGDLLASGTTIRYTESVDEFRQIAAIMPADDPVVNGGYALDADLLRRLPQVFAEADTVRVRVNDVLDRLDEVPLAQRAEAVALEQRANQTLDGHECQVVTRVFHPDDLPALYVIDPAVLRRLDRGSAREQASPLWASILDDVDELLVDTARRPEPQTQLCLNWANSLVRQLATIGDAVVFDRSVRLLYVQALLGGHHPLRAADRQTLSDAMSDLIQLSVLRE